MPILLCAGGRAFYRRLISNQSRVVFSTSLSSCNYLIQEQYLFKESSSLNSESNENKSSITIDKDLYDEETDPRIVSLLHEYTNQRDTIRLRTKQWRRFVQHLKYLRTEGKHAQALAVGKVILQNEQFRAPRLIYEEILQSLVDIDPTPKSIELTFLVLDRFIELQEMNSKDYYISNGIMNKLYNKVLSQGNVFYNYKYLSVYECLTKNQTLDTDQLYEQLVRLSLSSGELEIMLEKVRDVNIARKLLPYDLNEIVMIALLESGDVEFAYQMILHLYSQEDLFARTWGIFISHAAKIYHYPAIKWAWKSGMISGRVVLDDWTYQRLADIGRRHGDHDLVRWSFLRLKRRKQVLGLEQNTTESIETMVIPLIEAYAKNGDVQSIADIIFKLRHFAHEVKLKHIRQVVDCFKPTDKVFTQLSEWFVEICQHPNTPEAVKALVFNIILAALTKHDSDIALQFYRESRLNFNITANEDTILVALQIAQQLSDGLLVDEIFTDCKAYGIPMTKQIYIKTIEVYHSVGEDLQISKCIESMKNDGMKVPRYLTEVSRSIALNEHLHTLNNSNLI
jgi:hypothetical protein